ncbi:phosphopyruvate hydratase [Bauldia litoralis]|uniref:Enolase n=1 Tax=Bauldia litoralis TaxID=665467 RepID=A0A1G6CBU9_9HYPH|nr:phosphopyruvate hydratase [Bauldia litoralis]SDB30333.1 enolase [Bauldia litoralis]
MTKTDIVKVHGRRVWDSRGRPTVEAEVTLAGGAMGRAIAPAGASMGSGEAVDRRDGGTAFGGLDVTMSVGAVNGEIAEALYGVDSEDQETVDNILISLDGTSNKSRLGGNAIIAVSLAAAHARAAAAGVPLWKSLAGDRKVGLPLPEIQLFGGGAHAARRVDVQDFMVIAVGAKTFADSLDMTAEVYRAAGAILAERGKLAGVADEGGYWPDFDTNEEALGLTVEAIEKAGYLPGDDVAISLDIAASEFGKDGRYRLARESRDLDSDAMVALLLGWVERYPIVSIEDPLAEDDEAGLIAFTKAAGKGLQIIGDDYLVTNADRVRHGQAVGACNAVLVKPNQAGTVTETKAALDAAHADGWGAVVSARSGETEDVSIVHLAVGWGATQLKVGSFTRSERMAKWNEGLRVAEAIGDGDLPPRASFPWGAA